MIPKGLRTIIFLQLLLVLGSPSFALESSGPLRGTVLDAPRQPYYSFPGFQTRSGADAARYVHSRLYYLNEFRGYPFNADDEKLDEEGRIADAERRRALTAMDFEAAVFEAGISGAISPRHRIGTVIRLYSYYGGFLDQIIEGFHAVLKLPNASREYFTQGETCISIENDRGVDIDLKDAGLLFGDTEVYGIWTFRESGSSAWALSWAVELPTGTAGTPAGNGYIDLGGAVLWERCIARRFFLHIQQGVVLPGEILAAKARGRPLPMSQSLIGIEWPAGRWRLLLQSRIHSSPLTSSMPAPHRLFPQRDYFELPLSSIQAGLRRSFGEWSFDAYFEEDALTHEGPDIIVSFGAERLLP